MVFSFDSSDTVVDTDFYCVFEGHVGEGGLCRGVTTGDDEAGNELVTDDCGAGLFCATFGTERRCRALCDGGMIGCSASEFCRGLAMDPFLAVCVPADDCDPMEQDCREGEGCYLTEGGNGDLLSHCFEFVPPPSGTGEVGTACEFTGDCAPGSDCFPDPNEPSVYKCQPFCDPDAVDACPASQACVPIWPGDDAQSTPGRCE